MLTKNFLVALALVSASAQYTINNGRTGATYTCTAATTNTGIDFVTPMCKAGYFHTPASAAVGGTCTACTGVAAPGATVTGADLWTCTAAAGAIVSIPASGGCKAGYYRAASATAPGDTCAQCTSATGTVASTIANADTGAKYTCTSTITGIEFADLTVRCAKGYFYTAAAAAAGASCVACTGVAAPGATVTGADLWTCTAAAGAIVSIPALGGCKAGYYHVASATAPGDTCVQCTSVAGTVASSIANADTGAKYTCTSTITGIEFASGSVKCKSGYFYAAAQSTTGATCTACTGIAAPAAAVAGAAAFTCTAAAGAIVSIPSGGCKSGYVRVASATAPGDTCFACTGGYVAPAAPGDSASAVSCSIALLLSVAAAALSL